MTVHMVVIVTMRMVVPVVFSLVRMRLHAE